MAKTKYSMFSDDIKIVIRLRQNVSNVGVGGGDGEGGVGGYCSSCYGVDQGLKSSLPSLEHRSKLPGKMRDFANRT